MLVRLLLLFILVPLVELALLIRIGALLGFWPTMGLVIATGVLGAALARSQGLRVLKEIRHDLSMGRMPAGRLVDGLLVLIGGVTLLTPGFLTDIAGFLLLLPFTRTALREGLRRRFDWMIRTHQTSVIHFIR